MGTLYSSDDGSNGSLRPLSSWPVIELKRESANEAVVAQIQGYLAAARLKMAEPNQKVVGIVCVHQANERLVRAAAETSDVAVYRYALHFEKVNVHEH